jgi:hypothetical protein
MELVSSQQISSDELNRINFDLFLIVSGYEKRAVYLLENYTVSANRKIALAFMEKPRKLNRKENEKIIRDHGFEIIPVSGENGVQLDTVFQTICLKSDNNKVAKILIDYSSMTKVWYSMIISTFIKLSLSCRQIEAYFSYTPAAFNERRKLRPPNIAHSVYGDNKKSRDPSEPVALIIGLGLDNLRAKTIIKSINPSITYLLYADPGQHPSYVKKIFENNQNLIESIEIRNLINYPLNDLQKTDEILTDLCLDLRQKFNVIIAPIGPKVFSLISLLVAARYPDLDVWRVSRGRDESVIDRIPDGDPLIYKVDFVNADSE